MAALSFSLSLSLSFSFTLSRFFFHFFSSKVKVLKFECVCAHPSANKRCRPIGLSGIKSDRCSTAAAAAAAAMTGNLVMRGVLTLSYQASPLLHFFNVIMVSFLIVKKFSFSAPLTLFRPHTHARTHALIFTTPHLNMRPCWIFQVCGDLLLITHPSANCPPPPPTRTTLSVT